MSTGSTATATTFSTNAAVNNEISRSTATTAVEAAETTLIQPPTVITSSPEFENGTSTLTTETQNPVVNHDVLKNPNPLSSQTAGGSTSLATSATTTSINNSTTNCSSNSSSKRSLLTHSKDGKMLSEKKLRRLEKNRLSARECRRRKREATENLEREIYVLEGENLRLRLQLQIGEEAEESMRQEQEKLTEHIDALLKSGASEAAIYATIEEFKEKFADYGRDRRSAIEFHLRNIERLLMPTQTTTLAMRALQGGGSLASEGTATANATTDGDSKMHAKDSTASSTSTAVAMDVTSTSPATASSPATTTSASESAAQQSASLPLSPSSAAFNASSTAVAPDPNLEPKALFQYLVTHLGVTPEQATALKDSRFVAQEMDGILMKALAVLEELRTRLAQCGEDLETEFNNIRAILTPTQAAKFLIWVANNSACMHMLNELWSRVYPQTLDNVAVEGGGSDGTDSP